jgi:hypothetical protein
MPLEKEETHYSFGYQPVGRLNNRLSLIKVKEACDE